MRQPELAASIFETLKDFVTWKSFNVTSVSCTLLGFKLFFLIWRPEVSLASSGPSTCWLAVLGENFAFFSYILIHPFLRVFPAGFPHQTPELHLGKQGKSVVSQYIHSHLFCSLWCIQSQENAHFYKCPRSNPAIFTPSMSKISGDGMLFFMHTITAN